MKTLSLGQVHKFIEDAREIMCDRADDDALVEPTNIHIEAEPVLTIHLQQLLHVLNELDQLFHDRFDCVEDEDY